MASAKDFRTKPISDMDLTELKGFVKQVQGAGIKGSKEVDKAINRIKVLEPQKYGAKQVESAKKSLIVNTEIPNLQRQGITDIQQWKVAEQQAKDLARGIAPTAGAATGMTSGLTGVSATGTATDFSKTPEIVKAQSDIQKITAARDLALQNINDNPFYSEATRVGKIAKLNEKYNADLSLAQTSLSNAQAAADRAYKIQQDTLANNREMLKTYISTGALAGATEAELQQISRATNTPVSVLRGAIEQIRFDRQTKLKTEKNENAFDWNKVPLNIKGKAYELIQEQDAIKAGKTPDKQLSSDEIRSAAEELAREVGDIGYAMDIILETMDKNGYTEWMQ